MSKEEAPSPGEKEYEASFSDEDAAKLAAMARYLGMKVADLLFEAIESYPKAPPWPAARKGRRVFHVRRTQERDERVAALRKTLRAKSDTDVFRAVTKPWLDSIVLEFPRGTGRKLR